MHDTSRCGIYICICVNIYGLHCLPNIRDSGPKMSRYISKAPISSKATWRNIHSHPTCTRIFTYKWIYLDAKILYRGHYLTGPNKHVFKGKSLKTTVHLLLVWLPQNGSHLMIPASPSLVRRYQPSRPSERSGWEERPGYTQLFSSKQADSFCKQFKAAIFH